jgi:hypothetical protein
MGEPVQRQYMGASRNVKSGLGDEPDVSISRYALPPIR